MLKHPAFHIDVATCTGCKTCMIACKDKNDLADGVRWRRVSEYAGGGWVRRADNTLTQDVFAYYVSVACNHCDEPICVSVCPTTAMHKDESGIVLVDGAGLMNSSHGKRFASDGASVTVTDGPFAETRELIAGYSIWEVKDMDEAAAWAKRWPFPASGGGEIELRPLFLWAPAEESFAENVL